MRNPNRTFCNSPACQKVRKRIWQKQKMASDPDYKANQRDAQKVWRDANPDYYKEYRKKNDALRIHQKSRTRQADRNKNRRVHLQNQAPNLIAKMDALKSNNDMNTGVYQLIPMIDEKIANMDALIVQLTVMT